MGLCASVLGETIDVSKFKNSTVWHTVVEISLITAHVKDLHRPVAHDAETDIVENQWRRSNRTLLTGIRGAHYKVPQLEISCKVGCRNVTVTDTSRKLRLVCLQRGFNAIAADAERARARVLDEHAEQNMTQTAHKYSRPAQAFLTSISCKGEVVSPSSSGSCTLMKLCKFGVVEQQSDLKTMRTGARKRCCKSTHRRQVDPADKDNCAPGQAATRSDQHEMQDNEKANEGMRPVIPRRPSSPK